MSLQHDAKVDREEERQRTARQQRQFEEQRQTVFESERFAIGALQAVTGASVVAALSQAQTLVSLVGPLPFKWFLTLMSVGLAAAVLCAFSRHEYKKWDLKSHLSVAHGRDAQAAGADREEEAKTLLDEAKDRNVLSNIYLRLMRISLFASVLSVFIALVVLLFALWQSSPEDLSKVGAPATQSVVK